MFLGFSWFFQANQGFSENGSARLSGSSLRQQSFHNAYNYGEEITKSAYLDNGWKESIVLKRH